jgi:hypothetical protein
MRPAKVLAATAAFTSLLGAAARAQDAAAGSEGDEKLPAVLVVEPTAPTLAVGERATLEATVRDRRGETLGTPSSSTPGPAAR